MTMTSAARADAAARVVGIVAALCAVLGVSLVGSTAAVHAALNPPAPRVDRWDGFGDPSLAARYWRQQHFSDCGEMAVADVVGQIHGDAPDEQRITALAERTPSATGRGAIWNRPATTDIRDLPVLLGLYGITADNVQTDIAALERDLAANRKIIALLNAETIWNRPGQRTAANHFVVVTGIDAKAGVVHLNDSGIVSGRDEKVPMATFEKAWAPNHNSAIVTR